MQYTSKLIIVIALAFHTVFSKPFDTLDDKKCGYQSCHKVDPNKLNVHLVPHSHDDVGWLKTVDQYFYGNKIKYHPGVRGVQYIIDSVVQALQENPDRRFIQVETAFFTRWWDQQDEETKNAVKELVNEGRLEMVGGGWSMNDEAATNYQSVIDQFTLGLRTLEDLLGECGRPRVAWQIDPFGHTNEMANIFSQLGFDGLFFWRLDYRDVAERQRTKKTEFVWRGSSSLGAKSDIFTSLIYRFYNAPDSFCWDVQCNHEPIIDNKESVEYNVEKRVKEFYEYVEKQAANYQTNNILVTMGGDFTFQEASMYYKNMDKLIKGFKDFKPDVNVIYSTPSCYIKAVNEAAQRKNLTFTLKTDDFMPYASDQHSYWTGYYTSRPNSKRFERQGNNLLQVAKQMIAFEKAKNKNYEADIVDLKRTMGIMQHHDAITGTEKQHVANDYVRMLTSSFDAAEKNVHQIVPDLLRATDTSKVNVQIRSCLLSNVSLCDASTKTRFVLTVYNPNSRRVTEYVKVPVTSADYKVVGLDGSVAVHQVTPTIDSFDLIPGIKSSYELVFQAKDLPPLGLKYYYITKQDTYVNAPNLVPTTTTPMYNFGSEQTGFEIDQSTGFLKSIKVEGTTYNVKQEFLYYTSANGTNAMPDKRASGAYIFRPAPGSTAVPVSSRADVKTYSGALFDEVHQKFNEWVKQTIRVYKEDQYVEFDWVVGPVEYINKLGVEVITRFTTDLKSDGTFYTDSNGRSLVKRKRNHRETFTYTNEEPISGNYYPVTSRIVLKDNDRKLELAVLNDRAQGGSSLKDGEVELMIHRRLMNDDDFGVREALNELEFGKGVVVRGQHYLVMSTEKGKSAAAKQRDVAQRKLLRPWVFVGDASKEEHALEILAKAIKFEFSGLTGSLPENVQLLTVETMNNNTLLIRLEHTFEEGEDVELSKPVTLNLQDMFYVYIIKSIRETTLGGNRWIADNQKLSWKVESATKEIENIRDGELQVTLNPMEIRTFVVEVEAVERETGGGDGGGGGAGNIRTSHVLFALFIVLVSLVR